MIKQVTKKQREWGLGSPLRLACQKALDKLNEYYNAVQSHAHSSIATICDPWFNLNVFNILNAKLYRQCKEGEDQIWV
jgi:hypothetical protein